MMCYFKFVEKELLDPYFIPHKIDIKASSELNPQYSASQCVLQFTQPGRYWKPATSMQDDCHLEILLPVHHKITAVQLRGTTLFTTDLFMHLHTKCIWYMIFTCFHWCPYIHGGIQFFFVILGDAQYEQYVEHFDFLGQIIESQEAELEPIDQLVVESTSGGTKSIAAKEVELFMQNCEEFAECKFRFIQKLIGKGMQLYDGQMS